MTSGGVGQADQGRGDRGHCFYIALPRQRHAILWQTKEIREVHILTFPNSSGRKGK